MRFFPVASLLLLGFVTPTVLQAADEAPVAPVQAPELRQLKVSGYGDLRFSYLNYGANRNLKHGAQKDSRLVFDASRFAAEVNGIYVPYDVEFTAEVEFEHGGTGAAKELEYDESGDYQNDVSKGGEVSLEEFNLKKIFNEHYSLAVGRVEVAVGLLSQYSSPTDYLGVQRSETETTMLPGKWTEMGTSFAADYAPLHFKVQLVNGLDSTGFSSQYWIAKGRQGRFESISGTGLAGVLRADVTAVSGLAFGASYYYGNTSANRPQPDLARTCSSQDSNRVAPCGYINAPVQIFDLHAVVHLAKVRSSAAFIQGSLGHADLVSERNSRVSNALQVYRSPVGSAARGIWGECGYDIASLVGLGAGHQLEPYIRYESYDTMFKTTASIVKSPRAQRRVSSVGVAYSASQALFAKLGASQRAYGDHGLNKEGSIDLGLGFIY
jgi:hypothetical protein